jgi:hypothetical protein
MDGGEIPREETVEDSMSALLHGSGPLSVKAVHGNVCGMKKMELASIGLGLEEGIIGDAGESAAESSDTLWSSSSAEARVCNAFDKAATSFLSS